MTGAVSSAAVGSTSHGKSKLPRDSGAWTLSVAPNDAVTQSGGGTIGSVALSGAAAGKAVAS